MIDVALDRADMLVRSQTQHDKWHVWPFPRTRAFPRAVPLVLLCRIEAHWRARRCGEMRKAGDGAGAATCGVASCRLAQKPRDVSVVAAALVVHAEGMHGVTHSFHEIVMLLQGDESRKCVDVRKARPHPHSGLCNRPPIDRICSRRAAHSLIYRLPRCRSALWSYCHTIARQCDPCCSWGRPSG